jgi:hypothetical protein
MKGFGWMLGALLASMAVARLVLSMFERKPPDAPPEWHREPATGPIRLAPVAPAPPTKFFDEFGAEMEELAANDLVANFLPKGAAGPRPDPEPEVRLEDIMAPHAVDEPAGAGETPSAVTIVAVTSPVARGAQATLSARAVPGVSYTLSYTPPEGAVQELDARVAAADGRVSWTWLIESASSSGTGSILVTAAGDPEASAAATIDIS